MIENPKVAPPTMNLTPPPQPEKKPDPPPDEEKRKVFGVSRKALTDDSSEAAGPAVKQGNTLATAPDDLKLKDSDADSLPIPTDEYLLTEPPSVLTEVRATYPPEAKKKGIAGRVVIEILIDASGVVREARIISGPGEGLNEAALEALRSFRFKPAKVGEQAVAVRIRYTYNFELEN